MRTLQESKQKLYDYLGGSCEDCGATDYLDFHHRDPRRRQFNPWASLSDKVKAELDKCDLLCVSCHRKRHGQTITAAMLEYREARLTGKKYVSVQLRMASRKRLPKPDLPKSKRAILSELRRRASQHGDSDCPCHDCVAWRKVAV